MFKKFKRKITKKYLKQYLGINLLDVENYHLVDRSTTNFDLSIYEGLSGSYSQFGEDLIINLPLTILMNKKIINKINYLDIGGNMTKMISNTYFFYKCGWSGLVIEPNKVLFDKFLLDRPRDIALNVGIHFTNEKINKLPFYQFEPAYNGLSTFSKDSFEETMKKLNNKPKYEILEVSILKVNDIIKEYMNDQAPTFINLDVEGIDLQILKTFNFKKYRPIFFIIETAELSQSTFLGKKCSDITDFMLSKNYEIYADTYINTIYIDKNILTQIYE